MTINRHSAIGLFPVVFYGPGCGATACEGNSFGGRTDIIIVQAIAGADAKDNNIVPKDGASVRFQADRESTDDSPKERDRFGRCARSVHQA